MCGGIAQSHHISVSCNLKGKKQLPQLDTFIKKYLLHWYPTFLVSIAHSLS